MARLFLCIVLLLGAGACDGEPEKPAAERSPASSAGLVRAQAQIGLLRERLAAAKDRVDELEREAEAEKHRYVDLWTDGPTIRGQFLALPRLGVMRWTCGDRGFRVAFEGYGASVYVAYETADASRARMVHPGKSLVATVAEGESVGWTITHRHKPGFIRAHVDVTTARSERGNCLLPIFSVEEEGRLYD